MNFEGPCPTQYSVPLTLKIHVFPKMDSAHTNISTLTLTENLKILSKYHQFKKFQISSSKSGMSETLGMVHPGIKLQSGSVYRLMKLENKLSSPKMQW